MATTKCYAGLEERLRNHFDHARDDLDRGWATVRAQELGSQARTTATRNRSDSATRQACQYAILSGLAPYHPINVQTAFNGPVYGTPDGYRLVQIRVSTNYRQKTRFENRTALVDCRISPNGRILIMEPAQR